MLKLRTKPEQKHFKLGKPKLKMPKMVKPPALRSSSNPVGLTGSRKGFPRMGVK